MTKISEDILEDVSVQDKTADGILLWEGEDSDGNPLPLMTTEKQFVTHVYDSSNLDPDPSIAAHQQAKLDEYTTTLAAMDVINAEEKNAEFLISNYIENGVQYNPSITPKALNYIVQVTKKFTRGETFNSHGELEEVIYYEDVNNDGTLDNPVIRVAVSYERDALGNVESRETTRSWFKKDGTETTGEETKVTKKLYSGGQIVREGKRRRENIVLNLEIQVLQIIMITQAPQTTQAALDLQTNGLEFMSQYTGNFDKYIAAQSIAILTDVTNADVNTYAWLDDTITQAIIDALGIDSGALGKTVRAHMNDTLNAITV